MSPYDGLSLYFGDLHNHCDISYGHGSLEDAVHNAREQLDFFSVTGHAEWHDMPQPAPETADLIRFHKEGFARLSRNWERFLRTVREINSGDGIVAFAGYEMHSNEHGDYTVVLKEPEGEIAYTDGIPEFKQLLRQGLSAQDQIIAFPHHIAYKQGARGINWDTFTGEFSPVIEVFSMHGCSEDGETGRPFLHAMGPSDWESTMQYGYTRGHLFGLIASTDHHSAHPGSYDHGLTGVWSDALTTDGIFRALRERRTYAVTGDRLELQFSVNDCAMGSVMDPGPSAGSSRRIRGRVRAGAPIDYVDLIRNGQLLRRFSPDMVNVPGSGLSAPSDARREHGGEVHNSRIVLDVGWGRRNQRCPWDVELSLSDGEITLVEPRFRGREVLSPRDDDEAAQTHYESHWERTGERSVAFRTVTYGNPNTRTSATQAICLHVGVPESATVRLRVNGEQIDVPVRRLIEGPRAGYMSAQPSSPAWRLGRIPREREIFWDLSFEDHGRPPGGEGARRQDTSREWYYLRVRQKNGEWAWSSPVFAGDW